MTDTSIAEWGSTIDAFRHACDRAGELIRSALVADRWAEPSTLPGFSVGGIAGHLLGVVRAFDGRCDLIVPPEVRRVRPVDGYATVRLADSRALDEERFRLPREAGERFALRGPTILGAEFLTLVDHLDGRLRSERADRLVVLPDTTSATTLQEYTRTRIVEMVVHADDIAASVGVGCDRPSSDADEIAIEFLIASTRARVGDGAMLRALAGRAPTDDLRAL